MKRIKKDLSAVTQVEWAQLAMCIDCEGHIQIGQSVHKDPKFVGARQRYEYINLVVSNTDPRLMNWLVDRFGGRVYLQLRNQPARWKQSFRWNISCTQAAEILSGCLPHFVTKRDQAELALALQATMSRCGVRGTPQSVIDSRTEIRRKLKVLTKRGPQAIENAS